MLSVIYDNNLAPNMCMLQTSGWIALFYVLASIAIDYFHNVQSSALSVPNKNSWTSESSYDLDQCSSTSTW
jgi:hypothetical protein